MSAAEETIYVVELQDDGAPLNEQRYLRLPPPREPYKLRLSLEAGSKASCDAIFKTNYPLDGQEFGRTRFIEQTIPFSGTQTRLIELDIERAGIFEYFIDYKASNSDERVESEHSYFSVDPLLVVPTRSEILVEDGKVIGGQIQPAARGLDLDAIVLQTVIAKWMGTFSEWKPHLDLMRDRGYNMIHYTPLQQRGASNSPYSIFDQLEFADGLFEPGTPKDDKEPIVREWMKKIREKWGMLGMIDIVLNHTAHNSALLQVHPEAGYSIANSPHLRAAVELDRALLAFSSELSQKGLKTCIESAQDIKDIMQALEKDVLEPLKLWQFYVIDVVSASQQFESIWREAREPQRAPSFVTDDSRGRPEASIFQEYCLAHDAFVLGDRFKAKVDIEKAVSFVAHRRALRTGQETLSKALDAFTKLLNEVNQPRYELFDSDRKAILDNTSGRIRYTRLDAHGPRLGNITASSPLVESLFTYLPKNKKTSQRSDDEIALANNGWIWDANPLEDFASSNSRTYLRRDLIVWGDCVKLRYGQKPEDNPWLWRHMTSYVETLAGIFDGFRLDNCHSTPLHVGEMLLDAARRKNPNLYVCAELFTGSQELDLVFVRRLGINSLIREAMNASDPREQSSLLYRFGLGKPIGSLDAACLRTVETIGDRRSLIIPHPGSAPHALLMDVTHDNESPLSKRTAADALSTGALTTFAFAAVGSNRGFDDLYPQLLNVVTEDRHYDVKEASDKTRGIGEMKRLLNHVHTELASNGAIEGHFSQEDDIITAHRIVPKTRKGWLLVARTGFPGQTSPSQYNPITLQSTQVVYRFGVKINIASKDSRDTSTTLLGLDSHLQHLPEPVIADRSRDGLRYSEISIPSDFPPGSILVFETVLEGMPEDIDTTCISGAAEAVCDLTAAEINCLLFRAEGEEQDLTPGNGPYGVPDMAPLVYCGLQGWIPALHHIVKQNDLGHPLCKHLRDGPWAFDYVADRLERHLQFFPRLQEPCEWFKTRRDLVNRVPAFLRPRFFAALVLTLHKAAVARYIDLCSSFVQDSPAFGKSLALVSAQMYGLVKSASLTPQKSTPSLAAGLPHFAAGWARTWGRDVFISLRGLFLVPGQFEAAEQHILAFCSVVKHGLIPNLLDSGRTPRYNSRDSPWFMLQNIQDYVNMAPDGLALLEKKVARRFPSDDSWVPVESAYQSENTVAEIIHEIIQRHSTGLHFREHNAGPNLDMQMSDAGFNIDIEVDWTTGLIFGGNEFNCGTWQDKMGESARAGNKGRPGTSRHGAPIEITALQFSALAWLGQLSKDHKFPTNGVDTKNGFVTYEKWAELLQNSFERAYYVPRDSTKDEAFNVKAALVKRRGIYKDVVTSADGHAPADYQLRSNFAVAMTVAPRLFNPDNAWSALKQASGLLVGSLGMKTLDEQDEQYHGYYDNSEDSDNFATAKGLNYHQGPEWVWPLGYFLRALILFFEGKPHQTTLSAMKLQHLTYMIHGFLAQHKRHIAADPWAGLPELTNRNGAFCRDSCATQAWSSSTILDALHDLSMTKAEQSDNAK